MTSSHTEDSHKFPFLSLDTETINSKELQSIGSGILNELHESGCPKIVSIKQRGEEGNKEKRAVIVDYQQYIKMQEGVKELFIALSDVVTYQSMSCSSGISDDLQEELQGILQKIRSDLPQDSSIVSYVDRLARFSVNFFSSSEAVPAEATRRMQSKLEKSAKKVTKKHGALSKRPYQE